MSPESPEDRCALLGCRKKREHHWHHDTLCCGRMQHAFISATLATAESPEAEVERLRAQLATIADEAAVAACEKARVELTRVKAQNVTFRVLLERVVKYVREDRAVTPGCTRLARVVDAIDFLLAPSQPGPVKAHAFVKGWMGGGVWRCAFAACGMPENDPIHSAPHDFMPWEHARLTDCSYCRRPKGDPVHAAAPSQPEPAKAP